ncbi:MAG: ZIP family metal transporter [Oscillospiraceae bacterium]|nr:ZIP family metal transporter [Oscillospiraceae bacterium]
MQNAAAGIALSAMAGGSTVLGAVLCVFLPVSRKVLASCLGFAAGVMVTVSLSDLVPEALTSALPLFGRHGGTAAVLWALMCGMALALVLEYVFPNDGRGGLLRVGLLSGAALMLHNLPEGVAVFAGASADISLGASLAGAIALHNIPEGISTAMPVYAATKSRTKAVGLAAVSGLAEPLGAVMTYMITGGRVSDGALCVIFSAVAGLMVCLSFSELLPEGLKTSPKFALLGALLGVVVMVLSISVF